MRKEFITLKRVVQEFAAAVFTERKPGESSFWRLTCEIASENGATSRRSFYDFAGTFIHQEATNRLDDGSFTFNCGFKTDAKSPEDIVEDIGTAKIYLESSPQAFPADK